MGSTSRDMPGASLSFAGSLWAEGAGWQPPPPPPDTVLCLGVAQCPLPSAPSPALPLWEGTVSSSSQLCGPWCHWMQTDSLQLCKHRGQRSSEACGGSSTTPDSTQRRTPRTQCLPSVGQVEAKPSPSASLKTQIRGSCGRAHSTAPATLPPHPSSCKGTAGCWDCPPAQPALQGPGHGKAVRLSGLESSVPGEGHGAGCQGAEEGSGRGRERLQGHEETQGGHRPRNPERAQTGLRPVRTGRDVPCATRPRGGQGFLSPTHAPPGTGPRFSTWSRTLWLGARGVVEMDRAVGSSPLGAERGSGSPVTARRPLAWLEPALLSAAMVDGLGHR
ncbi:uncharacterized protein LOC132025953 [Mustela nigripes]|uniref:uncharacterized protein LOC132025953 n=1 Tax=Mustela nigripes TaxID=77151 RepID=UPI00281591E7|nr:uncharacterized protein LOC132025953 [Mustela nigripes]